MSEEFKSDDQALPLYDQSALNTIAGFMSTMFRLHDIKQERCLPARVVEYDRNTNKATVSPIVKYSTTTSEGKKHIDRPEYDNIYVLGFGSSRYSVTAPLVKGDLGILVSCDRSWSAAKEVNSEEDPEKNQGSMPADNDLVSSFENGIFIPCSFADCDIPDDYKKALVIKALSESGNNRKVVIDADDLDKTDAKFRDAIVISREIDEETGKQRFVYKKHKVLMDEGSPVDTKSVDDGTSSISVGYMNAYFSIYAPADREGYSIRAGRVCVDDDQFVDVPEPEDPLDPELEYYCCVKIIRDTGIIAGAEIISFDKIEKKDDESDEDYNKRIEKQKKQFEEYNPEDFDTCRRWIVPIGNIDEDGNVTQYHIGAINLSSDVGERPDFKIYISGYNTETGCYKYNIAGGQVVANGKLIDVEGVEDIELETDYWCKVTFKRQTQATLEKLEAEIVDEEPIYPTLDTEIVWKVKIGQATSSAIVQNHIGAVTFSMPNRTLWFNGEEITRFFGSKDADLAQWFIETQYWPAFSCRWVSGSNECEFFLPNGSAYYNGKAVDFSTNFEVTTGDWKQPTEEVDMSGTIYCWIGLKYTELGSSYTAHFSNSIKGLGTDEENENVVLCFPVCSIGQTGETVTDGITQIASGEMIFGDHFTFAFKIEKIFDNWEIFLPAGSVVRMHKSDSDSDKGVIKFDPLDISDDMAAGESGRDDWYDIPNVSSGTSVYAVFTQDREDPETEGSAPGKYKRNFTSYEIKTSVTSTDRYIKIAKIVGGTSNIVEQIVESAIVLKEDSKHVDSIIGENTQSGTEIISSEKIDGDIEISGRLDPDDEGSSCGITFTTISAREASGGDPARPARIVANIKNRDANEENWGVHEIKFSDTSGQRKTAHVFACEDIEIGDSGGGGGGGTHDIVNVIGSDYVDVSTTGEGQNIRRVVSAKINTPNPDPASGSGLTHALITSDTEQRIRAKKIFAGTGDVLSIDHIDVDGPNGKVEVVDLDQTRKIVLDAGLIDSEADNKVITVKKLTKATDEENPVAILANDDIEINDCTFTGDTVTSEGGGTITPETISGNINITGINGTSCGIEFMTVSSREGTGGDPDTPAKIIATIKNRPSNEANWGSHTLKYTNANGAQEYVHFLGCTDVDITDSTGGGSGSHNISNVIGSDYIDVNDKTVEGITKREVRAKIITPDPDPAQGEEQLAHALITSDTDQKIRCVKTFTGTGTSANNKRVIVDGPNGKAEVINTDEKKIILDAGNIPNECNNNIDVHWLKYKDLNNVTHIYHGLFCDNIDLTKDGKLIKKVDISQSSASGGRNVIVFTYTDDSQDTIIIYNGQNGNDGAPGQDGETPEIEIEDIGTGMHGVFVDGELKATIKDGENGVSPIITMGPGTGTPKEYPILSNGIPIGSVHDGADGASGSVTEQEFITDITFSRSGSSIIATITKKKGKIIELSAVPNVTKTVLTGTAQSVVESEAYSTSTRQFTNTRKSVVVLSSTSDIGQTVFTAEPHSMT